MNEFTKMDDVLMGLTGLSTLEKLGEIVNDYNHYGEDKLRKKSWGNGRQLWDNYNREKTVPYSFKAENGIVNVEAVVAGHEPEDIKVLYNKNSKTLKITDIKNLKEETPWYYNDLKLEFTMPDTIYDGSFKKNIKNGVLTVEAEYGIGEENSSDVEI